MHFTRFINNLKEKSPELDFETVKKSLEEKNLVVKSFRGLNIVSYSKYPNRSNNANPSPDFNDPLVRECRGLIFNSKFEIVCPGFNKFYDNETDTYFMESAQSEKFVPELSLESDEFKNIVQKDSVNFSYAIDSSLVRLYYFEGRWRLATTRSIDATKTRWNSYRTFFQLFMEAAQSKLSPLNMNQLDESKVYFMALVHPENRIVTPHTQGLLFHLTTFVRCESDNENDASWKEDLNDDLGIARPIPFNCYKELEDGSDERIRMSPQEIVEAAKSLNWVYAGIVVRWLDEDGNVQRTKIRCTEYEKVAKLRGDRRSMVERYLELKTDADKQDVFQEFVKYYPEYKSVEQSIENFTRAVHQMYLDFYVHRSIRYISEKPVWEIIQELHTRYLRTKEKTTLNLVRQHVHSLPFPVLSELLLENKRNN